MLDAAASPRTQMALRAFRLMMILRPSTVCHKFRDDAIIPGGRPVANSVHSPQQCRGVHVARPRESCAQPVE